MTKRTLGFLLVCVSILTFSAGLALSSRAGQTESEGAANYEFIPGEMYRMPTHFGPSTGPRRGEDGKKFANKDAPKTTSISVSFLTDREPLARLLPDGFSLGADPVVTVRASYITEIPWLAGRGYNTLGVSFPAVFDGNEDRAVGSFLLVLWENLTDPILTGREELGFSKIYAELPEPRVYQGETHVMASWMGFKFLDLNVTNLEQVPMNNSPSPAARRDDGEPRRDDGELRGTLHFKYFPRTGEWGTADVAYAVLTPSGNSNSVIQESWRGEGTVEFHKARWEDMPTQHTIVNTFADLPIKEYRGARITKTVGGKDLSDQRILR